jgi:hypothetical protein
MEAVGEIEPESRDHHEHQNYVVAHAPSVSITGNTVESLTKGIK